MLMQTKDVSNESICEAQINLLDDSILLGLSRSRLSWKLVITNNLNKD